MDGGLALRFDGVDDVVQIDGAPAVDDGTSFTAESSALVDEPCAGVSGRLIDRTAVWTGGFTLQVHCADYKPHFTVAKTVPEGENPWGSGATGEPLAVSVSHDLAGSLDGNTASLWIDGDQTSQGFVPEPATTPEDVPLRLGSSSFPEHRFRGAMDQARLMSRALATDELLRQPAARWSLGALENADGTPLDSDGDGVPDDGDAAGVVGDHPCAPPGSMEGCDDSCPYESNVDQTWGLLGAACPAGFSCARGYQEGWDYCRSQVGDSVYVPAGPFLMGCDVTKTPGDTCSGPEEGPAHIVDVPDFQIDRTEVTVATYSGEGSTLPQTKVNWVAAKAHCEARGNGWNLCSEAEWEKAARGGCEEVGDDGSCAPAPRVYPWSASGDATQATCEWAWMDDPTSGGFSCGEEEGPTHVDAMPQGASIYGAVQMSGNVLEFVEDCWHSSYSDDAPGDGSAWTAGGCEFVDATPGFEYTKRGGSYGTDAVKLRTSYRSPAGGVYGHVEVGFRCCKRLGCPPGSQSDPTVGPGQVELCDSKDNDCDGEVDEACLCGLLGVACPDGFACEIGEPYDHCISSDGDAVYVPGGGFYMGCNIDNGYEAGECDEDEKDEDGDSHLVDVPPFSIHRTEVTVGKYAEFLAYLEAEGTPNCCANTPNFPQCILVTSDGVPLSQSCEDAPAVPPPTLPDDPMLPVEDVTWGGAKDYCQWLGDTSQTGESWRLCSEAEWEKAARGGCETVDGLCQANMRVYPWSDADKSDGAAATCEDAWIKVSDPPPCAPDGPAPVTEMLLDISPYGALQMAGNLREWTEDCYHLDYVGAPTDGVPWTADCESGEGGAAWRVIRGGSYDQAPHAARAASRREKDMWVPDSGTGFRCCKSE